MVGRPRAPSVSDRATSAPWLRVDTQTEGLDYTSPGRSPGLMVAKDPCRLKACLIGGKFHASTYPPMNQWCNLSAREILLPVCSEQSFLAPLPGCRRVFFYLIPEVSALLRPPAYSY